MTYAQLSRRENRLSRVLAYAILAAALVIGVDQSPTAAIRWTTIVLSVVFGLVMIGLPSSGSRAWAAHLYLAVQSALTTILLAVHPEWTVFTLLFFVLSAQAMVILPPRQGATWIAIFVAITFGFGIYRWGWSGGLLALLLYAGGYAFFGVFAHALARADAARRESQALLAELQEAHRQLQEHALHAEELAVVQERNRLAREMHDTIGHRLTVASVQLEGAQRLCALDPERAAGMVGTVRGQVREALSELRGTVATLRTPVEADLQLRSALKRLMDHYEQATGFTVHRILPEKLPDLPDTHRLALYRAAQEALTNIQRHTEASQVWLVLSVGDNIITLLVGDDGKGISVTGDGGGFGLRGLRERAAQLGGELHLEPRPGGGTQLSFRLPLSQKEEVGGQASLDQAQPAPRFEAAGQQAPMGADDV